MTHAFRICLTDPLIIEWRLEQDGAQWGFYKVCDSPNDAIRALSVIRTCHSAQALPRGFPRAPTLFSMSELEVA